MPSVCAPSPSTACLLDASLDDVNYQVHVCIVANDEENGDGITYICQRPICEFLIATCAQVGNNLRFQKIRGDSICNKNNVNITMIILKMKIMKKETNAMLYRSTFVVSPLVCSQILCFFLAYVYTRRQRMTC